MRCKPRLMSATGKLWSLDLKPTRNTLTPRGCNRFRKQGRTLQRRALYPNGSNYTTLGFFGQDSIDLVRGKLRAVVGGRMTAVMFRTFEERNRDSFNRPLGVVDSSQSFSDVTFNTSLSWQMTSHFALNFLVGRGFRAPNLNDLGAIGLNDLGYEVPAAEVAAAEALVGTDSGEGALSIGKRAEKLQAEKLYNYELGFTVQTRRLYGRVHVFDAELLDPIVRRTLLFEANRVPGSIAGIPVLPIAPSPLQQQQGVVTVATAFDPRAVKAFVNDGQQRFYGWNRWPNTTFLQRGRSTPTTRFWWAETSTPIAPCGGCRRSKAC